MINVKCSSLYIIILVFPFSHFPCLRDLWRDRCLIWVFCEQQTKIKMTIISLPNHIPVAAYTRLQWQCHPISTFSDLHCTILATMYNN